MPHELEQGGEVILETKSSMVLIPQKPLVPPEEGINLSVVKTVDSQPYFLPETKIEDSFEPLIAAIATARSVFGESGTDDYHKYSQWVNVHYLPRFGGDEKMQIEVIGRNARGRDWAKPVKYPQNVDYEQYPVIKSEIEMIRNLAPKIFDELISESQEVTLFDQERPESAKDDPKTLVSFGKFDIRAARETPHVEEGGLHLWVHQWKTEGEDSPEGMQSRLKYGVEQSIVAQAVAKAIYQELGIPVEIHFSGNWGLPSRANGFQESLSAHANIYGAPPGKDFVALPERPAREGSEYLRPNIPEETREKLREALEKHFLTYAEEFKGKKLSEYLSL